MIAFRRTDQGESNKHLLLGVDKVIYVEGGESLSLDDVLGGSHNTEAIDIRFWQKLCEVYLPGKKLDYRAVGSKATLKGLARVCATGQ